MRGSDLVRGGVAGFLATLPMTLAMEGMHALLPGWERYPLPPREITEEVAGVRGSLDEPQQAALTIVNHFAYGAGAGAVYGAFADRVPAPPALCGMVSSGGGVGRFRGVVGGLMVAFFLFLWWGPI